MAVTRMSWMIGAFYIKPLWTVVPDTSVIEAISRRHLFPHTDGASVELRVKFLAKGAFNKVYTVDTKTTSAVKSYIFRATLPVEPSDKVRNEVATLDYIKQRTTIPVPSVIATILHPKMISALNGFSRKRFLERHSTISGLDYPTPPK